MADKNLTTAFQPKPTGHRFKDLEGQTFGRLTVVSFAGQNSNKQCRWLCRCVCGSVKVVQSRELLNHDTQSCGCLQRDRTAKSKTTHGMRRSPTYGIWAAMLTRCRNPNQRSFRHYGGRGITVCDRWLRFENFYADMGEKPSKNHSINRIDNDGDYCSENCEWATRTEQANNTRSNRQITWNGQTRTLANWAKHLNVPRRLIDNRLRRKWSVERAFTTPLLQLKGSTSPARLSQPSEVTTRVA